MARSGLEPHHLAPSPVLLPGSMLPPTTAYEGREPARSFGFWILLENVEARVGKNCLSRQENGFCKVWDWNLDARAGGFLLKPF